MKKGKWNRKITDRDLSGWLSDEPNKASEYANTKNISYRTPFSHTLDCHGLTVQDSYEKIISFIETHAVSKSKSIKIITGKSGQIKTEFPLWMSLHKQVRSHSLLKNGGSWIVNLKIK